MKMTDKINAMRMSNSLVSNAEKADCVCVLVRAAHHRTV